MPRIETVTTPPTLGAGRRFSYSYPAFGQTTTNNVPAQGGFVTARPNGIPSSAFFTTTATGAPPAPEGATIYLNRVAWAITSGAATGRILQPNFGGINRPLVMPFQSSIAPGVNFQGVDDYWCWSISAILAFDAIPGAITGDIGLSIGVVNRAEIRTGPQFAGMEFGPTNTGTIGVIIRQTDGGAVSLAQNVTGVADMTLFHKYEIRLLSATRTADARVKFMIDGQTQLDLSYGAGTVLPAQTLASPNNIGFTPSLINKLANAATTRMYLAANGMTVCAAPNEESLP